MTAVLVLADLLMVICAVYIFVWGIEIAASKWPHYWWLTALMGLAAVGLVSGIAGAIFMALHDGEREEPISVTVRRAAVYVVAPGLVGLIVSVLALVVVVITIPSFF